MKTFAAIDIGSYELAMKIFEFSGRENSMRKIDHIRHRLDLGSDTYTTGKLKFEKVEELCRVLEEYEKIMKGYRVDDYKVYGTSAIREMENSAIVLDQISQRTGLSISVLSNSEQRFLDYKSIAAKGQEFDRILEKGTLILDIGGGSIQLSVFDKGTLSTSQNLRLGVLRLRERLQHLNPNPSMVEELLTEMIDAQLSVVGKLYLKDRQIEHVVLMDDYLSELLRRKVGKDSGNCYITAEVFREFLKKIRERSIHENALDFGISEENMELAVISGVLLKCVLGSAGASLIWAPDTDLCDGMAYDYASKQKISIGEHDFEQDIVSSALNISKRYMGSRKRAETLELLTMNIFDATKKLHGLGKRERLLLRISAILHDCGKYISMVNLGECSYRIIMATEIIGLSHAEREIVANIVRFNHDDFVYYDRLPSETSLDRKAYLTVAKLTAILRIANGLDRSHKQKFKNVKVEIKEDKLLLHVDTAEDISLERGLFEDRAEFFEEVFNIRPEIRQKRSFRA